MSKTHATISPTWIELVMALCGIKFLVEPWWWKTKREKKKKMLRRSC